MAVVYVYVTSPYDIHTLIQQTGNEHTESHQIAVVALM